MKEAYALINPRSTKGAPDRFDARVPLRDLVPGLALMLEVNATPEARDPVKVRCTVRHVHYAHRWIRVEYRASGKKMYECFKFVVEGE